MEDNIGESLDYLVTLEFLVKTPKAQPMEKTVHKWDIIRIKNFCFVKDTVEGKKKPQALRKMFAKFISDKGLVSKIYKELWKFNNKKMNNPI